MSIPIEDGPSDIVRKAMTGLGLRDHRLEELSGADEATVAALKSGRADAVTVRRLAPHLGLDAEKLIRLAAGYPAPPPAPAGLVALELACPTPAWPGMTTNAYVVHAPGDTRCLVVDTGTNPAAIISEIRRRKLSPEAILLTHGHFDHADGLPALRAEFGDPPAFAHPADAIPRTFPAEAGAIVAAGPLRLVARATPGHTEGGLSWVAENLAFAFTGDALFAGSVGGAPRRLAEALAAVRRELLSLPGAAVFAPGHGPLTTAATELEHNPFFPA